jgi:hypothetical protein
MDPSTVPVSVAGGATLPYIPMLEHAGGLAATLLGHSMMSI